MHNPVNFSSPHLKGQVTFLIAILEWRDSKLRTRAFSKKIHVIGKIHWQLLKIVFSRTTWSISILDLTWKKQPSMRFMFVHIKVCTLFWSGDASDIKMVKVNGRLFTNPLFKNPWANFNQTCFFIKGNQICSQ